MFWLIVIWIIAALCGLAAAAVWEPLLALVLATARMVDPGLASYLAQYAGVVEAGGDAVGWLVALVVGLPLALLWLVLRVVGSALRGPDEPRRGHRRPDVRERPSARPSAADTDRTARTERADRPVPRGSTVDVRSPQRPPNAPLPSRHTAPMHAEPAGTDREADVDRAPTADTPRWGRQ